MHKWYGSTCVVVPAQVFARNARSTQPREKFGRGWPRIDAISRSSDVGALRLRYGSGRVLRGHYSVARVSTFLGGGKRSMETTRSNAVSGRYLPGSAESSHPPPLAQSKVKRQPKKGKYIYIFCHKTSTSIVAICPVNRSRPAPYILAAAVLLAPENVIWSPNVSAQPTMADPTLPWGQKSSEV